MLIVCYPKCTTCKKAQKWLADNNISFEERNIKEERPSADELKKWITLSKLPVRRFFNTSGMLYREMQLKEKLPGMSDEEMISLLSSDGMLVKRPILVNDETVLVGFKEDLWKEMLLK